ncbi:hypothetical protein SYNPS1DRAFT_30057 [Syncephalis pseudoplumigaleata]|uniref:Uncharacterized protein n=1 Tax=Syncephalis pseudoplumigaleata TaxID=1712513 RepID=A0A4P9YW86_9FUNG|nr:hypothetical protein SYNPS1DRAFT_30057 [Syncephalis pseudoplumigaleata]|eukprot:RKP24174.1 hypothetical protein SYNPS1DRAFT_30057 [Syncephalis pseudoplumigaleata]
MLSATARPGTFRRRSRSVPRLRQGTPPLRELHDRSLALLQRVQKAEPRALNRRLRRAYDAEELASLASTVLNDVMDDVHTLPDRFTWLLYETSTTTTTTTSGGDGADGKTVHVASPEKIKDINHVPFTTSLGDFIAMVDLVTRLLEEAVELQRTLNALALSYVQTVEERSREAVGTDYIGDAMHAVWQVRGSASMMEDEEAAAAAFALETKAALNLARMKHSGGRSARIYQTMPSRRSAPIGPGTWADWARQQFGALRRQQAMQANTISPQRGTISDDVTSGAFGRRRPRLVAFLQNESNARQQCSDDAPPAPSPPPPILTAREVLLNRVGWTPSGEDAATARGAEAHTEDGARSRQRRETIAAAEQYAATQRTSWWWPQPLAAYFIGGTGSSGSSSGNSSANGSNPMRYGNVVAP